MRTWFAVIQLIRTDKVVKLCGKAVDGNCKGWWRGNGLNININFAGTNFVGPFWIVVGGMFELFLGDWSSCSDGMMNEGDLGQSWGVSARVLRRDVAVVGGWWKMCFLCKIVYV